MSAHLARARPPEGNLPTHPIPQGCSLIGKWTMGPERVVSLFQEPNGLAFSEGDQRTSFNPLYDSYYAANLTTLFRRTIGANLQAESAHPSCFLPQLCTTVPNMPDVNVALFGRRELNGELQGLRWGVCRSADREDRALDVIDPVTRDFIRRAPQENRDEMAAYATKFCVVVECNNDALIRTVALKYQRTWYETEGKTCARAIINHLSDPAAEAPLEILLQLGLAPDQVATHCTEDEKRCFQAMLTLAGQMPEEAQKNVVRKLLQLYPSLLFPLFPHVLSSGKKHTKFEFILESLKQGSIHQNPNIRLVSETQLNAAGDPRCGLLNVLNQHRVNLAGIRALPGPVIQCEDLTVVELTHIVDLYLKIEKTCGPFNPEGVALMWKAIEAAALKRDFFPPVALDAAAAAPSRPSSEDIRVYNAVRLLSLYPDLRGKFAIFDSKICGMLDEKLSLLFEVFYPLCVPEASKRYGLTPVNGILLYGPQGCGKTFFADVIAEAMGGSVFKYSSGRQGSKWANETENNICKMFDDAETAARSGNPSVIFIDESSSVFPKREGLSANQNHVEKEVNEFLQRMEGCGEKRLLVVGATNHPLKIDEAAVRAGRLERKFYLPPPDAKTREELFRWYSKGRPMQAGIDYGELAANSERFVSSDIKLVMNAAAGTAALRSTEITSDMIRVAMRNTQPSLTVAGLAEFERVKRVMNPPR